MHSVQDTATATWMISEDSPLMVTDAEGTPICTVTFNQSSDGSKESYSEAKATAKKIAAAPALLEACCDILDFLKSKGFDTRKVSAAIAQAS